MRLAAVEAGRGPSWAKRNAGRVGCWTVAGAGLVDVEGFVRREP